jgi:hypothetical protein
LLTLTKLLTFGIILAIKRYNYMGMRKKNNAKFAIERGLAKIRRDKNKLKRLKKLALVK